MIISHANLIVDYDPMTVARRTQDTMRYVQAEWNKSHAKPIDAAELHKFLCDEHYGDLTEEQKIFVRLHRDRMRNAYGAMVCQLLLCGEMLREIWCRIFRPTVPCSTQKEVMCRGRFIGQVDRRFGRFAADERKAGERTGAVGGPVHPTNARSAGIFKGLWPGTL